MALITFALLFAVGLVVIFRKRSERRLLPESLWCVEFDEEHIRVTHPQGELRVASWSKLSKVAIRTTDDGPFDMDLFWGLHENGSAEPTLVFPGGATGEEVLLKELGNRLPDCNHEQIVSAMASTSNAYFVVWEGRAAVR